VAAAIERVLAGAASGSGPGTAGAPA
jgi:hypothetical protein